MGTTRLIPLALAAFAFLAAERDAHALGPVDVEAAGKIGGATNPDTNGVNPYGFGLGVRGGVGISNVWLGASLMHYFGTSTDLPVVGTVDYSSTLIGGELGYTIKVPLIDVRPQVGLGNASFSASAGGVSNSTSKLYIEPGVAVLVPITILLVGVDANALIVPGVDAPTGESKTYTSFAIHGQIGVRL